MAKISRTGKSLVSLNPGHLAGADRRKQLGFELAWDSDVGAGSLREDLFWMLVAASNVFLNIQNPEKRRKLCRVMKARDAVWINRYGPYDKARWRELDDSMSDAFGALSGWP